VQLGHLHIVVRQYILQLSAAALRAWYLEQEDEREKGRNANLGARELRTCVGPPILIYPCTR
jgi:hypothetical protein